MVDILHVVCWGNNLSVDILSFIVLRHDVSGGCSMGLCRANLFISASSCLPVEVPQCLPFNVTFPVFKKNLFKTWRCDLPFLQYSAVYSYPTSKAVLLNSNM